MSTRSLPVFVINLASADERRARMVRLLEEQGVSHSIVQAVDGRALDAEAEQFWKADPVRARLNPGEIGCLLSHRKIWQRITEADAAGAIVLEDDLCFARSFAAVIGSMHSLPQGIGLLRLESDKREVVIRRTASAAVGSHSCHLTRRGGPVGSGAYAIDQAMAKTLLGAAKRLTAPVDAELFDAKRSALPDLTVHQLVPPICMQAQFDTDLAESTPFLASTIAAMGERADRRLGIQDTPAMSMSTRGKHSPMRRFLRPLLKLLRSSMLAPRGWRRLQVRDID